MGKKIKKRPRWRHLSLDRVTEARSASPAEQPTNSRSVGERTGSFPVTRSQSVSTHVFDEKEYTKIQTPRQDMIFKKNVLVKKQASCYAPVYTRDNAASCQHCAYSSTDCCDPACYTYPCSSLYNSDYCTCDCYQCTSGAVNPFACAVPLTDSSASCPDPRSYGSSYLPDLSMPPPPLMLDMTQQHQQQQQQQQHFVVHLHPLAAGSHLSFSSHSALQTGGDDGGGGGEMVGKSSVVSAAAAAVARQVMAAARGRRSDGDSVEGDTGDDKALEDSEVSREEEEASLTKLLAEIQYAFIDPSGNIYCNVMDDTGMIHLPAVAGYYMASPYPGGPLVATPVPWQAVAIAPLASPSYRLLQLLSRERVRQLQDQLEARILLQCHQFQQLLLSEHQRQLQSRLQLGQPLPPAVNITKDQLDMVFLPPNYGQTLPVACCGEDTYHSESSSSDDQVTVTMTPPVDLTCPPPPFPPTASSTTSSTSGAGSGSQHSDLFDVTPVAELAGAAGETALADGQTEAAVTVASAVDVDGCRSSGVESGRASGSTNANTLPADDVVDDPDKENIAQAAAKSRRVRKRKKKKQKKKVQKITEPAPPPPRRSIDSVMTDESSDVSRESGSLLATNDTNDTSGSVTSDPAVSSSTASHSQSCHTSGIQSDISAASSPARCSSDSEEESDNGSMAVSLAANQQLHSIALNLCSFSGRCDDDSLSNNEILSGERSFTVYNEADNIVVRPASTISTSIEQNSDQSDVEKQSCSVSQQESHTTNGVISSSSSFSNDSSSSGTVIVGDFTPSSPGHATPSDFADNCGEMKNGDDASDETNGDGDESCDSIVFSVDAENSQAECWDDTEQNDFEDSGECRPIFTDLSVRVDLRKTVILEETESEPSSSSLVLLTDPSSENTSKESSVERESRAVCSNDNILTGSSDISRLDTAPSLSPVTVNEKGDADLDSPTDPEVVGCCASNATAAPGCDTSRSADPPVLAAAQQHSNSSAVDINTTAELSISQAIRQWMGQRSAAELFTPIVMDTSSDDDDDDDEPDDCDSCSEALQCGALLGSCSVADDKTTELVDGWQHVVGATPGVQYNQCPDLHATENAIDCVNSDEMGQSCGGHSGKVDSTASGLASGLQATSLTPTGTGAIAQSNNADCVSDDQATKISVEIKTAHVSDSIKCNSDAKGNLNRSTTTGSAVLPGDDAGERNTEPLQRAASDNADQTSTAARARLSTCFVQ